MSAAAACIRNAESTAVLSVRFPEMSLRGPRLLRRTTVWIKAEIEAGVRAVIVVGTHSRRDDWVAGDGDAGAPASAVARLRELDRARAAGEDLVAATLVLALSALGVGARSLSAGRRARGLWPVRRGDAGAPRCSSSGGAAGRRLCSGACRRPRGSCRWRERDARARRSRLGRGGTRRGTRWRRVSLHGGSRPAGVAGALDTPRGPGESRGSRRAGRATRLRAPDRGYAPVRSRR